MGQSDSVIRLGVDNGAAGSETAIPVSNVAFTGC